MSSVEEQIRAARARITSQLASAGVVSTNSNPPPRVQVPGQHYPAAANGPGWPRPGLGTQPPLPPSMGPPSGLPHPGFPRLSAQHTMMNSTPMPMHMPPMQMPMAPHPTQGPQPPLLTQPIDVSGCPGTATLLRPDTHAEVLRDTGVQISIISVAPKSVLQLAGSDPLSMQRAAALIRSKMFPVSAGDMKQHQQPGQAVIENVSAPHAGREFAMMPHLRLTGGPSVKMLVGVEVSQADALQFPLLIKLVGPRGSHLQHIENVAHGSLVTLAGKGTQVEKTEPLNIFISADHPGVLDQARLAAQSLIDSVRAEYDKWSAARGGAASTSATSATAAATSAASSSGTASTAKGAAAAVPYNPYGSGTGKSLLSSLSSRRKRASRRHHSSDSDSDSRSRSPSPSSRSKSNSKSRSRSRSRSKRARQQRGGRKSSHSRSESRSRSRSRGRRRSESRSRSRSRGRGKGRGRSQSRSRSRSKSRSQSKKHEKDGE